jgi:hypothetical protein
MASSDLRAPPPPEAVLRDEVIELRLLRVLRLGGVMSRPPEARFLAAATECRFAIHRRPDAAPAA